MGGTSDSYHRLPRAEALRRSAALQLQNGALQHFSAAAPQSLASDDAPRERNAVRRPHSAIRRRPACESGRPAPAQILSDPLAQCEQMHGEAVCCHLRQGAGEVHDRAAHHGVLRASAFALPGSCWSRAAVCSVEWQLFVASAAFISSLSAELASNNLIYMYVCMYVYVYMYVYMYIYIVCGTHKQ
jgi:hypothetical protein